MDTLIINDGTTDRTYKPLPPSKNGDLWWKDVTSTMANPRLLRISFNKSGSPTGSDSFVVQFLTTMDDAEGLPYTGSVHKVLKVPREGVTEAGILAENSCLDNLLGSAQLSDLLKGLVPTKAA